MGIKTTSDLVHEILKTEPECRNSDNILYLRVLQTIGKQNGIDVNTMSVPTLFLNMHSMKLPAFETVRRTRQKIQHHFPELSAHKPVSDFRAQKEKIFREYAREELQ